MASKASTLRYSGKKEGKGNEREGDNVPSIDDGKSHPP